MTNQPEPIVPLPIQPARVTLSKVEAEAARLNVLPEGVPMPSTVSEAEGLLSRAVLRLIDGILRVVIEDREGGRFPEPAVLQRNLEVEISPANVVLWRWRSSPALIYTPGGLANRADGCGLEWHASKVEILGEKTRIMKLGAS